MAKKEKASMTVPAGFTSANVPVEFWKPEENGDFLRGWYQGARLLPAKGQFKEQVVYDIADENGELFVVTGASLHRQFERINEGDEVIVTFNGRKEMKGGKAPMKDYTVLVKGELRSFKKND